jgi:hypothetical protein
MYLYPKCVSWSPFYLPPDFNTPLEGIKVLGVPLIISSFKSSFIKYTLVKNVLHVDLLILSYVYVAF